MAIHIYTMANVLHADIFIMYSPPEEKDNVLYVSLYVLYVDIFRGPEEYCFPEENNNVLHVDIFVMCSPPEEKERLGDRRIALDRGAHIP